MAKPRFVESYSCGLTNIQKALVDTQTGVNYLLASSASNGTVGWGLTVLLDSDGKPVVTPADELLNLGEGRTA